MNHEGCAGPEGNASGQRALLYPVHGHAPAPGTRVIKPVGSRAELDQVLDLLLREGRIDPQTAAAVIADWSHKEQNEAYQKRTRT
jgi:hypothetical protein